ncbi:hypothetical protein NSK_006319 [Nannochloropsis salina CCMP1776]|uniref:Uncharacterized protein n=1 Tax=Nannochloropsis salina CCMP1776 TaxID=1027361 RepID=A0A4D9CU00_9STRA|nr:hypothetical protein NSK_006319 [Nannochloropsis salina CCMP1776]|eukprot:TFJ82346.1 hypothetical protein NSK_006319 [Nannochloropsis salina CCMP1776]
MGSVPSAVVKPAVIVPPPSASSNTTLPDDEVLSHASSYSSVTSTSVLTSPTSCTYIFDSLWFCLSPVYQAKEYYISGDFDACEDKASALYMCLANKIKKDPDIARKIEAKLKRPPIQPCWTQRRAGREDEEEDATPVWDLKERPGWY